MICVNTDLKSFYDGLQQIPVGIQFGTFQIHKPLLLSINDGLMVQLFFLVGLELKWEVLEGGLSESANVVLPALGGMVIPVCLYWLVNRDHPVGSDDWAIPMATDIAFALGLLSLLGPRLMISLKIFLVSLAIFVDIGAIVVIALFFTANLSPKMLWITGGCLAILFLLNRRGVTAIPPYCAGGCSDVGGCLEIRRARDTPHGHWSTRKTRLSGRYSYCIQTDQRKPRIPSTTWRTRSICSSCLIAVTWTCLSSALLSSEINASIRWRRCERVMVPA